MKRTISAIGIVIVFAFLLTACRQMPVVRQQESTTLSAAGAAHPQKLLTVSSGEEATASGALEFYSTDGSVWYSMSDFPAEVAATQFPVVRVKPHSITGEDAKRLAETLFPGQTFMEYSEELSKSEIEENIQFWRSQLTEEVLFNDFGPKAEDIEVGRTGRTAILNDYITMLDTAPESVEPQECLWTYFPYSHYLDTAGMDFSGEHQNYCIEATTEVDGIPYFLWYYNADPTQSGGLQNAFIYVDDHMSETEHHALLSRLCGSDEPTPTQTAQVRKTAENLLAKVSDLTGVEWKLHTLDAAEKTLSNGNRICYFDVLALPSYAGAETMYLPSYARADILEKEGAAYYGFEQLDIQLTKDGKLLTFELSSPLDVVEISEPNTQVYSAAGIPQQMQTFFQELNAADYLPFESPSEKINVRTYISRYEIGLSRVQVNSSEYKLIPAMTVYGSYSVRVGDSEIWNSQNMLPKGDSEKVLLVLSLSDGSIITTGI